MFELAEHTFDVSKIDAERERKKCDILPRQSPHDAERPDFLPVVLEYSDGKLRVVSLPKWVQVLPPALERKTTGEERTKKKGKNLP